MTVTAENSPELNISKIFIDQNLTEKKKIEMDRAIHYEDVATVSQQESSTRTQEKSRAQELGTNLIHDFTAVTFSVKLAFFREKRPFP